MIYFPEFIYHSDANEKYLMRWPISNLYILNFIYSLVAFNLFHFKRKYLHTDAKKN